MRGKMRNKLLNVQELDAYPDNLPNRRRKRPDPKPLLESPTPISSSQKPGPFVFG